MVRTGLVGLPSKAPQTLAGPHDPGGVHSNRCIPATWVNRHLHLIPWQRGVRCSLCTCYGLRYIHGPVTIGRLTGPGLPFGTPGLLLSAYHAGS